jgi:hypothetical protein
MPASKQTNFPYIKSFMGHHTSAHGAYNADTLTTVSSTPSYLTAIQKPVVTLDIQTLPRRIDPCLNARQVLQRAIEKKLKLEAVTLSALGLSPV